MAGPEGPCRKTAVPVARTPLGASPVQLELRMIHNIYNNRAPEDLKDHFQRRADSYAH